MAVDLETLLECIPEETEEQVQRVRDSYLGTIRSILRSECRLYLNAKADDDSSNITVPIHLVPGYPHSFKDAVVETSNELDLFLQLVRWKRDLESVAKGMPGLIQLRDRISSHPPSIHTAPPRETLIEVQSWINSLLEIVTRVNPLQKLLEYQPNREVESIEEILGSYHFGPRRQFINIYWAMIGMVSMFGNYRVEHLALITLTHELAHAYTHLGADTDGNRWDSRHFGISEPEIVEGLAQYYTRKVLQRLENKVPGVTEAFDTLADGQPEPYSRFRDWLDFDSEDVRRAMIETRRHNLIGIEKFEAHLDSKKVNI